ncbi:MAG: DUF2723 domain-containing protein [Bacteroidetes bacterium]|nr:DUF2723 domain-containing protein [Bacteroidota bacterium]
MKWYLEHKTLNRIHAFIVFAISLGVYIKTLSPTVVFWDVGEFCAAAYLLQVPHPPGAPLFLLIARVSSMIPFVEDIAVRMHILSAIGSAITCALLYLIIIDLICMWRGEPTTLFDKIILYGSAIVGALSLTFNGTFWFNAVEAEVYGLSMLFVSSVIWLGLRWYKRAESDSGDRYILLIAYIIGLSVGVHLLAVLTIFPILLLYYFRYNTFEWKSFIKFGVLSLIIFFIIYPGIVKEFPSLLDGEFQGIRSKYFTFIPLLLLLSALYGVYYSYKKQQRALHVALLAFLFIVLGYSTYIMVYIRANANPPMNENNPSTISRLVSYLNREQYGSAPILKRRWDPDPEKQAYHKKYSSDLDYFWRYQTVHMYFRYLGWNYIGCEGDYRDAGVQWSQYFMIPFLLGLIGAYYQWKKQPSMAFTMLMMFIIMGVVLAWYQNQQEPQPRERDYFYVGSFFVFSLWIGIGVLAVVDFLKQKMKSVKNAELAGYGTIVAAFALVPLHMLINNYHRADRTGNYVAWDYSYNLLQSCEPDAILFTNGDNDTFPVWYLQDVEGVRRDIRVVNLSLVNTPWYIMQLKHQEPHGAKKVPISIPDAAIENILPIQYETRTMALEVPKEVVEQYIKENPNTKSVIDSSIIREGILRFTMPSTLHYGNTSGLRVQDIMVYDIIRTNRWKRPIYFAMTVSDDGKIGLREYLQLTGLAFKLVPARTTEYWANINEKMVEAHLFTDVEKPSKTFQPGFLWRGLQDSSTYFDEDTRRLITANYRNLFFSYALHCMNAKGQREKVATILDRMEQVIPRRSVPIDYRVKYDIASFYALAGKKETQNILLKEIIDETQHIVKRGTTEQLSQYNPYIVLFLAYTELNMFNEAEDILNKIRSMYASHPHIDQIYTQLTAQLNARRSIAGLDSTKK